MTPAAFIPAAGTGSRMGCLTTRNHKALLRIGGRTILEHALRHLRKAGLRDVIVATGHCAGQIEDHLPPGVRTVHNPSYRTLGLLGSFRAAAPLLSERPFLFTTADHFFAARLVPQLLCASGDMASLVQTGRTLRPEASKYAVLPDGGHLFGKDLHSIAAAGEYCGMTRFSTDASSAFFAELVSRYDELALRGTVMDLLNILDRERGLSHSLTVCGEQERIEIDNVSDLIAARRLAATILVERNDPNG